MNLRTTLLTAVTVCVALVVAASTAEAQDSLRWKFAANDAYEVDLVQTTSVDTVRDKRSTKSSTTISMKMEWKVTALTPEGNAKMTQSIRAIQLAIVPNGGTAKQLKIDTNSKEKLKGNSAKLMKQIMPLIDSDFEVVVSPRGEIVSVSIPEPTLEKFRGISGSLAIRGLMTEKGIRELLGQSSMVLPESALSKGQSWSENTVIESAQGKQNRVDKYTFTGTEETSAGQVAVFNVESTLTPEAKGETAEGTDDEAEQELVARTKSFSGKGKLQMNVEAGYFSASDITNEIATETTYRQLVISSSATTRIKMDIKKK